MIRSTPMPFPRRFQALLETELQDVEVPDYVWLTYCVCAAEQASCGWAGWMIECAFKRTGQRHSTGTGDMLLSAPELNCPTCGLDLFRTGASLRLDPSDDQRRPGGVPGVHYEVARMEYED